MKKVSLIIALLFFFSLGYSQSCLPEGIEFLTQAQIDSFQINYPGCTEIEGDVIIRDIYGLDEITNLDGLIVLTSIDGNLWFSANHSLDNFSGLNNLVTVGGNLEFTLNLGPTSLLGFENLTSIGGDLWFWKTPRIANLDGLINLTTIAGNMDIGIDSLSSVIGLMNLTYVGGHLSIEISDKLQSLKGLDNIDPYSIDSLLIRNNSNLSDCEVLSICNYISLPTHKAIIAINAVGCNSTEEVLDSCEANAVSINEQYFKDKLLVYPNPAFKELHVSTVEYNIGEIVIYTLTGQQVLCIRPEKGTIDISNLKPGLYIMEAKIENRRIRQKLIVE